MNRIIFSAASPAAPVSGDPAGVISRALSDARRRGLDDLGQTRCAVAAVLVVRPDMSAIDAARSVERVRRSDLPH
jgi:hypothetical protein